MKIALIRLSSLGDIVHTLGALKAFKSDGDTVYWLVDEDFAPLLEGQGVEIIALPLRRAKRERSLTLLLECYKKIRALPVFDVVVDMQGLLKSALILSLLKGEKFGFDKHSAKEGVAAYFYDKKVSIAYKEPIAKRNMKLLSAVFGKRIDHLNTPFLSVDSSAQFMYAKGSVMFAIGSSKKEKRYPKERFVELANMLKGDIYIISTPKEMADAEFIATHSKAKIAPYLNLDRLPSFLAQASLLIGNDSGVSYIAWALGIKTILLFGPTDINRFCPKTSNVSCLFAPKISDIKPLDIVKLC